MRTVERASVVAAPVDVVWDRVTTIDGINDELGPWLSMSMPHGEPLDVQTVAVGRPLGRSWIRLLGVLPIDADDLTIAELEPGRRFVERSTMLSARRWQHERELSPLGADTRVRDTITFDSRLGVAAGLHASVVERLFAHRQRRLVRHFART